MTDFSQCLQANAGNVPQLGYGRLFEIFSSPSFILSCHLAQCTLTCCSLTTCRVFFGYGIYWTRGYILKVTITQTSFLLHGLHCRCLVTASNVGRSTSCGFPNGPRPQPSASNSNTSQQLNSSSDLTNSLTQQLTSHSLTDTNPLTLWLTSQ
jgi:hypothetical protein